jgi:hypothetical protein
MRGVTRAAIGLIVLAGCYRQPSPPPVRQPVVQAAPVAGWIQGVVKNEHNEPVPAVMVEATAVSGGVRSAVEVTDERGYYKIEVAPGDYIVQFVLTGGRELERLVQVVADRSSAMYVTMPVLPSWGTTGPGFVPNCADLGEQSNRLANACFP